MELDRDVHRARDLEDRGRHVAVERDLAVRIVVGEHDVVPAARRDRPFQILARRHRGGGVVGIIQIDEPGALQHVRGDLVQLEQEIGARREIVDVRLGVREHRPAVIDRVARHGHDGGVTRIQNRRREMRDAFF